MVVVVVASAGERQSLVTPDLSQVERRRELHQHLADAADVVDVDVDEHLQRATFNSARTHEQTNTNST